MPANGRAFKVCTGFPFFGNPFYAFLEVRIGPFIRCKGRFVLQSTYKKHDFQSRPITSNHLDVHLATEVTS